MATHGAAPSCQGTTSNVQEPQPGREEAEPEHLLLFSKLLHFGTPVGRMVQNEVLQLSHSLGQTFRTRSGSRMF